ncbi:MAG TPA: ATP-binding protein [Verrucomicrobiae bacterium]|nr:ATP-binding protein [Verrucomicrobiae bacterium]
MATVLVIDDKPTNRDVLRAVLGYQNHRIIEAEDGAEGLEKIRAERPDLVIADILMPHMDGYEMVRSLRRDPSLAGTRVIFYTAAYLKSEAIKLSQACGVTHLIVKPADPQEIIDMVHTVLSENAPPAAGDLNDTFDREHLRLITNMLSQKVRELEDSNRQLIEEVAQRKRAEDALRASEARIRGVLDAAIDSIITLDSNGQIVDLNAAAEANLGYRREAILGKPLADFMVVPSRSEKDFPGVKQLIPINQAALLGRRFETTAVTAHGAQFPVEITVTRIATDGSPMYTAFLRDLTEQRAREEMRRRSEELEKQNRNIQQANQLKSEFLANMSHELRTPLNAIIGFSELMHDGRVGVVSENHKEYLGDILTAARHLLQLINDILDLSKVEAGRMEFAPEPVELDSIIAETRSIFQGLPGSKVIQLQFDVDPSLTDIVTDPRSLKQILYNYISNAIKFSDEGSLVRVQLRAEKPGCFRIAVEDSGIGIRNEDIGKLFKEFQQIDNSMGKQSSGTGLGLALTKRIVEGQGGRVGVLSTPGHGSLFYAVLPRVAQTAGKDSCSVKST